MEAASVVVAAKLELVEARAALGALPSLGSPSPLADRLGIAGWELDLTAAALASLAANGLAAILITFGVHGLMAARFASAEPLLPTAPSVLPALAATNPQWRRSSAKGLPKPKLQRDPAEDAERFMCAAFAPRADGRVQLRHLRSAYRAWCETHKQTPLPDREIGPALRDLFSNVGFRLEIHGSDTVVVGIEWKPGRPGAPLLINGGGIEVDTSVQRLNA
jgi:hypothetical protein